MRTTKQIEKMERRAEAFSSKKNWSLD